jgi:hypothetical protein
MKFIPTIFHCILDYIIGLLVLLSPWIFDYKSDGAETWGPTVIVGIMFAYNLLTDSETGLIKFLAMPAHLWFDIFCGITLAASPWIFDFKDVLHAPQIVIFFGILITLNGLFTETLPSYAEKKGND